MSVNSNFFLNCFLPRSLSSFPPLVPSPPFQFSLLILSTNLPSLSSPSVSSIPLPTVQASHVYSTSFPSLLTSFWLYWHARCNGVCLFSVVPMLSKAPCFRSISTSTRWPKRHALCSGVSPAMSVQFTESTAVDIVCRGGKHKLTHKTRSQELQ